MARFVILYATHEGQTAKIAHEIAGVLRADGHEVKAARPVDLPPDGSLDGYDAVVIGSPIHKGEHDASIVAWAKRNRDSLEARHGAFFSVSLAAAGDTDEDRKGVRECLDRFFEATGWRPALVAAFAGALAYSQYGLVMRFIMKRIAASHGGDTDVSRDYEYTDWDSVVRFARDVARSAST